jgi:trans-aconitate methyltransferase
MTAPRTTDWDARAYTRLGEPQFRWAMALLDQLELRGDETVLDAGCGSGRVTAALLERVPRGRVIACDISMPMLAQARATLGDANGRIEYVHADLAALGLEGVAEVVFSAAVFHWIPEHRALFRSLFRALVPGGRLHAQCGGEGNLARILDRADQLGAADPFAPYLAGFARTTTFARAEESELRLADPGFAQVRAWITPAPTAFASRDVYAEFVEKVVLRDHLARLPDAELRRAYVERLTDLAATDVPPLCLDYVRLDLRAVRPRDL